MKTIFVTPNGKLNFEGKSYRCALGRSGIVADKKEGDHGTPEGYFSLESVFYRGDKLPRPETGLRAREILETDGWCDDPHDPHYNELVTFPYPASAESLWRKDSLYDIVVVIGYNRDPIIPGDGSAIFMHVARLGYEPTEGCVALSEHDLLELLKEVDATTRIQIG